LVDDRDKVNTILTSWLVGDIEVIEKVQEKAVRMVSGLKGTTYEERCAELGLETLKGRRDRQDMALAHKYVISERRGLFTLASTNRGARTRSAAGERCLVKQFARTDTRKISFAVRAVDSWNELPDSVRAEREAPTFQEKAQRPGSIKNPGRKEMDKEKGKRTLQKEQKMKIVNKEQKPQPGGSLYFGLKKNQQE
jgi:hypothetical protein